MKIIFENSNLNGHFGDTPYYLFKVLFDLNLGPFLPWLKMPQASKNDRGYLLAFIIPDSYCMISIFKAV